MEYETKYVYDLRGWTDVTVTTGDREVEDGLFKIIHVNHAIEYVHTFNVGFCWHRVDGPARIFPYAFLNGSIEFFVNGSRHKSTTSFCDAACMSDEETFMWVLRFGDKLPDTIEGFYGEAWKDMSVEEF